MSGRQRAVVLAAAAAVLLGAAAISVGLYSTPNPWRRFDQPLRRFLSAAAARDSVFLRSHATGAAPIAWALNAMHPDSIKIETWSRVAHAVAGVRRGDTTVVLFAGRAPDCNSNNRLSATFVRRGDVELVSAVASACVVELPIRFTVRHAAPLTDTGYTPAPASASAPPQA